MGQALAKLWRYQMKKFIYKILVFLAGTILLLGMAEYIARYCPNSYRMKEDWMQPHAPKVETLILGPSYSFAGFDPQYFKTKAFNLANSNQTPRYDWLLLAKDSTRLTSLRTVILPSAALQMNYALEDTPEWYRCIYYQIYHHIDVYSAFSKYGWELSSLRTCQRKVEHVLFSEEADQMCDDNGRGLYYKADSTNLENLVPEKLAERIERYADREVFRSQKEQYIDLIASYCQRHNIRIVMVGMPVSRLFYSCPQNEKSLTEMDQAAQSAIQAYPCIEYRNYVRDERFCDLDFYDVDHLNDRGAQKLTQIVCNDFDL